jgi:hypothetical protein
MQSDDWITPQYIIEDLGPFDLDPCASLTQPWATAKTMFTKQVDGLSQPWQGLVWLNPPYNRYAEKWMKKLSEHSCGIALVYARTETRWFHKYVWKQATSLRFLLGRISFCCPDGKVASPGGAPSVLVAYGDEANDRLYRSTIAGIYVSLNF